jgi:hypothetical protein
MKPIAAALVALLLAAPLSRAQDLADVCRVRSSYDLTLSPGALAFDRTAPAPRHMQLGHGRLAVDGRDVTLDAEQHDRAVLFEQDLRALVPKVRALARRGVDVALDALRAEAAGIGDDATQQALEQRLAAHAADLKRRIDRSTSTLDWQGERFTHYIDAVLADVAPSLAGALAEQAVQDALAGDIEAAAALRERAAGLATGLQPRLEHRLEVLRPQVQALCPSVARLAELQRGLRDANGRALDLLEVGPPAAGTRSRRR